MARGNILKHYGSTGLARGIAVRLGRFHNWNCPSFKGDVASISRRIGCYGEWAAASWCRANGWKILRKNWKYGKSGELDLVCRDGECLVFAEVKTRSTSGYGNPARAVNSDKRRLIRSGGREWLRMLDNESIRYRYDVIEVVLAEDGPPSINHIPFAFGEKETKATAY